DLHLVPDDARPRLASVVAGPDVQLDVEASARAGRWSGRRQHVGVLAVDWLELGAAVAGGDAGGRRGRMSGRAEAALLDGLGLASLVGDVHVEAAGLHRARRPRGHEGPLLTPGGQLLDGVDLGLLAPDLLGPGRAQGVAGHEVAVGNLAVPLLPVTAVPDPRAGLP